ncbi:hypothetical protein D1872_258300 [compost metagenome]
MVRRPRYLCNSCLCLTRRLLDGDKSLSGAANQLRPVGNLPGSRLHHLRGQLHLLHDNRYNIRNLLHRSRGAL